ncbi:hypothetical protein AX17_002392 [Amanita inopinata Kibby_2008]|nr:hypothetical protein AX17_002392 [Amanita inopinata Kibby_2008]
MKRFTAVSLALASALSALANPIILDKRANPLGIDISNYQPSVDFNAARANGIEFVYIKATEGTTYTNPSFSSQYTGATQAGLIRGSYHFAHPDSSTGADQANFFLAHGGGWSADGITLPGALDIEYNPNGAECYNLSPAAIVAWVSDFANTYLNAAGRYPVLYTTTDWWTTCTGDSSAFSSTLPLWIANYNGTPDPLPAGYPYETFWQYANSGPNPGDQDLFNGDSTGLSKFVAPFFYCD